MILLFNEFLMEQQLSLFDIPEEVKKYKSKKGLILVKSTTNNRLYLMQCIVNENIARLDTSTVWLILDRDKIINKTLISKTFLSEILSLKGKSVRLNNNKTPLHWITLNYTDPNLLIRDNKELILDIKNIDFK